jgi:acyl carrier protein
MEIEKQLKKVFSETFNVPEEKITSATHPSNFEEWDSLGQLRLFMNMESEFQISFRLDEIKELNSFETILKAIQEKKDGTKIKE